MAYLDDSLRCRYKSNVCKKQCYKGYASEDRTFGRAILTGVLGVVAERENGDDGVRPAES